MLNRFKEFALPLAILSFLILNLNLEAEDTNKKVFVHYMPWYSSKSVSGDWGWHWTMNKFNPEHIKERLVEQITGSVRWSQSSKTMASEYDGCDWHELAPSGVLRGLMRRIERTIKVVPHDEPTENN